MGAEVDTDAADIGSADPFSLARANETKPGSDTTRKARIILIRIARTNPPGSS